MLGYTDKSYCCCGERDGAIYIAEHLSSSVSLRASGIDFPCVLRRGSHENKLEA